VRRVNGGRRDARTEARGRPVGGRWAQGPAGVKVIGKWSMDRMAGVYTSV